MKVHVALISQLLCDRGSVEKFCSQSEASEEGLKDEGTAPKTASETLLKTSEAEDLAKSSPE